MKTTTPLGEDAYERDRQKRQEQWARLREQLKDMDYRKQLEAIRAFWGVSDAS